MSYRSRGGTGVPLEYAIGLLADDAVYVAGRPEVPEIIARSAGRNHEHAYDWIGYKGDFGLCYVNRDLATATLQYAVDVQAQTRGDLQKRLDMVAAFIRAELAEQLETPRDGLDGEIAREARLRFEDDEDAHPNAAH